jgi:hypothetical protein
VCCQDVTGQPKGDFVASSFFLDIGRRLAFLVGLAVAQKAHPVGG